jgi:hypothetical protein
MKTRRRKGSVPQKSFQAHADVHGTRVIRLTERALQRQYFSFERDEKITDKLRPARNRMTQKKKEE